MLRTLFLLTLIFSPSAMPNPEVVPLLRKYCKACHAVGMRKFILSENDYEVWHYIFSNNAPSGRLWAKSMSEVLDWPTNAPPDPDQQMEPERDWMPKGNKRYEIVQEVIGGKDARQIILEAIKDELLYQNPRQDPNEGLLCTYVGQGFAPTRISDGITLGLSVERSVCEEMVDGARAGVVCTKFVEGPSEGRNFKPTNIQTQKALGRYPETKDNCTGATLAAQPGVVCTYTGIGWKPTNTSSGEWFGSSSLHQYCTKASANAYNGKVCAWFSGGDGSGVGWYLVEVADGNLIGSSTTLDECIEQ